MHWVVAKTEHASAGEDFDALGSASQLLAHCFPALVDAVGENRDAAAFGTSDAALALDPFEGKIKGVAVACSLADARAGAVYVRGDGEAAISNSRGQFCPESTHVTDRCESRVDGVGQAEGEAAPQDDVVLHYARGGLHRCPAEEMDMAVPHSWHDDWDRVRGPALELGRHGTRLANPRDFARLDCDGGILDGFTSTWDECLSVDDKFLGLRALCCCLELVCIHQSFRGMGQLASLGGCHCLESVCAVLDLRRSCDTDSSTVRYSKACALSKKVKGLIYELGHAI